MTTQSTRQKEAGSLPDPLLKPDVVCERLNITRRHLTYLVQRRRIPFVKVGSLLRFDEAEIARWIDRNRGGIHS